MSGLSCICVDDTQKPNDIPLSHWIKKGKEYTIINIKNNIFTKEIFLVLEEVSPTPPYGGYKISRFAFDQETFEKLFNVKVEGEPAEV